jgi:ketosteroid isomerase-like protein
MAKLYLFVAALQTAKLARDWGYHGERVMKPFAIFVLALLVMLPGTTALAQDIVDDEADVLLTIERAWEAIRKGDHDAVAEMLADNFMGWSENSPAPRSKNSTVRWMRLSEEMGKVLRYELYPLSITVNDDVAVAHYLYSLAFEGKDDGIEMSEGRYTDVLIRNGDGWQFLAWHGGKGD